MLLKRKNSTTFFSLPNWEHVKVSNKLPKELHLIIHCHLKNLTISQRKYIRMLDLLTLHKKLKVPFLQNLYNFV